MKIVKQMLLAGALLATNGVAWGQYSKEVLYNGTNYQAGAQSMRYQSAVARSAGPADMFVSVGYRKECSTCGYSDIILHILEPSGVNDVAITFGFPNIDEKAHGVSLANNPDELLIAGTKRDGTERDGLIIRAQSNFPANLIWQKTYGEPGLDEVWYGVIPADQVTNEYILYGTVSTPLTNDHTLLVARIKDNGDLVWMRKYNDVSGTNSNFSIHPQHAIQNNNGNVVIAGNYSNPYGQVGDDVFIIELDGNGNVVTPFTTIDVEQVSNRDIHIDQTSNGDYVATFTTGIVNNNEHITVARLDPHFHPQWAKLYSHISGTNNKGVSIYEMPSNTDLAVFVQTNLNQGNGAQLGFIKLQANGTSPALTLYTGLQGYQNSLYMTPKVATTGYLLHGFSNSGYHTFLDVDVSGSGSNNICANTNITVNSMVGDISTEYLSTNSTGMGTASNNIHTHNNLSGTIFDCNSGSSTFKNAAGIQFGVEEISLSSDINVYPTILTDEGLINIDLAPSSDSELQITVMNNLGQEVYNNSLIIHKGKVNYSLPISKLSKGIYFLLIYNNQESLVFKERLIQQ